MVSASCKVFLVGCIARPSLQSYFVFRYSVCSTAAHHSVTDRDIPCSSGEGGAPSEEIPGDLGRTRVGRGARGRVHHQEVSTPTQGNRLVHFSQSGVDCTYQEHMSAVKWRKRASNSTSPGIRVTFYIDRLDFGSPNPEQPVSRAEDCVNSLLQWSFAARNVPDSLHLQTNIAV